MAIKNLKIETDGADFLLNVIIQYKLDHETIKLYETSIQDPRKVQKFNDLMKFLEERFLTLDTIESGKNKNFSNKKNERQIMQITKGTPKCIACGNQDITQNCENFKKLSPNERSKMIRSSGACINCLHPLHKRSDCKSKHKCSKCQKNHHTLLHFEKSSKSEPVTCALTQYNNVTVLLATAIIRCYDRNGISFVLRAMIDQGSQASIITERAAQLLKLDRKPLHMPIKAVGEVMAGTARQYINMFFSSNRSNNAEKIQANVIIMRKIMQKSPRKMINTNENWHHLNNLPLADPKYNIPSDVDILLGGDVWDEIVMKGLRLSKNGSPVAQRTKLGWILNGKVKQQSDDIYTFATITEEEAVDEQLKRFWQLEEMNTDTAATEEQRRCEAFYDATTIRDSTGRYIVRLPFTNNIPILGRSRNIAVAQLLSMERKFRRDPELKRQYIENMREYFANGHIVEVTTTENQHRTIINGIETFTCAYLPHHAVIKSTSTTTQCRCVFDASRATTNGKCLNEQLMTGATIQDDIMTILCRWRAHKFVINGDIARMYRQIRMNESDAEYQRIVWREDETEPIRDYKLTTVTFGTTSAPYWAIKTIQRNADDERDNFPVAAEAAKKDFYVDDFYAGADTQQEAIELRTQITDMLHTGGFQIRKWISNDEAILQGIPEEEREIKNHVEFGSDNTVKTLGLRWNPTSDTFSYKTANIATSENVPTKREFLSTTAKIYDPVGWLGPTIILIKILYQKLWINKVQWDEKIPEEVNRVYQQYRREFPLLEQIRVPRWINITSSTRDAQLHGFCDASTDAYAAAVYLRIIRDNGDICVFLLASKTRVVPIKQRTTIPKLELNAAVLLTNLFRKIKHTMKEDYSCIAWSDSTITLSWIKATDKKLPSYVATRVHDIQAAGLQWRYIPTDINPADCASRGLTPSELLQHELWWKGPQFLYLSEEHWPENLVPTIPEETAEAHVFSITTDDSNGVLPLRDYSSFSRLQRVTAYCQRFINNCKTKQKITGPLTANELDFATIRIIQQVQQESFPNEIQALTNEKTQVKGNLTPLNPFLDDNHIMRVNGRLEKSNLPYHQKYPMILPKNHHVTMLLIILAHLSTCHGGATLTLNYLRNKFWIPNGFNTVKKYVRSCQKCARFNAKTMTQKMASLPEPRVNVSRPFTHTGIDYAGPIDIRTSGGRGQKTYKGYIAIFICLVTKAIHIEAVSSLTSTAFIAAFRRFSSRRGFIKHLYSDNGTNFVGSNKILKDLEKREKENFNDDVYKTFATQGVQWHFNPPASPHFGGL